MPDGFRLFPLRRSSRRRASRLMPSALRWFTGSRSTSTTHSINSSPECRPTLGSTLLGPTIAPLASPMDNQLSIDIEVRGLRKSFAQLLAVNDLSFSVPAGQVFGLVGPDGAGKSTTIRMLAGILPPDAGEIRVAGCDVVADPESVKPL